MMCKGIVAGVCRKKKRERERGKERREFVYGA